MTIEEMKARKRELGLTNRMISEKSGVPLSTVQKVFSGFTTAPRRETIIALQKVLGSRNEREMPAAGGSTPEDPELRESRTAYNTKRGYTLEDYLALPEDQRVELIDGAYCDMAAPATIHQGLAGMIYKKLLDHVLEHKGPCYPFISPVDVQLDCDDKTVVQPDVMIICDRGKHKNGRIFGAPDMVVEILSPSTRKKDMFLKLYKYGNAGVREYWIIDPLKKIILQYDLEHADMPAIYGFDDKVPVLIWNSECIIDFKEVDDAVSFLWDVQ